LPIWKVLAGLVLEPQKIRLLANFGAATPRLKAATEQGDLERGMQFIGQSQGLIHDVCTADEMMQRLVTDIEQSWQQVQCLRLVSFFFAISPTN
jgi:enoyl-[acyl-carrier protein] reductase II